MAFTASSIDDILLPPPAKVLKRGTPEIEDAMNKGEVTFSLPPQELAVWLHPHQEQQECAMDVLVEDGSIMASDSNGSMHSDYSNFHDDLSGIQTSLNKEMGDERRNHQVEDEEEATQTQRDDDRAGNDPRASCDTSASSKADVTPSNARKRDIKTMSEQPKTRFRDIIGHGAVKLRLDEILLPLALPTNLADSILTGIRSLSASILLYGPPGCGKTELAKAIAGEAQAAFLSVGPSDILSKFVGESEASIRSMFDKGT
jgi:SpoVK/Ycf46/Vps4 family AAA+-type ATPase